jgi:putative SOS response-associated peptidase YedK
MLLCLRRLQKALSFLCVKSLHLPPLRARQFNGYTRRCIISADGFYEWQRTGGRKQPFYFHFTDDGLFGFAGLWEKWRTPERESLETCSILTTGANEVLKPVHERMPVILHPDAYDLWLDEEVRKQELRKGLLCPFPASEMAAYPVSVAINSPQHQGEELVKPTK